MNTTPFDIREAELAAEARAIKETRERLAQIREQHELIRKALVNFPSLRPGIVQVYESLFESIQNAKSALLPMPATASPTGGEGEGVEEGLTQPDQMEAFLLRRANRPATIAEIAAGTQLPKRAVKNILYMRNQSGRFVRVEEGKRVRWKLPDDGPATRPRPSPG